MEEQSGKGTMFTTEEGKNISIEKLADNRDEVSITVHQQPNSNSHEITESESRWLSSLEKSRGYPSVGSSQKPKIQMVPKLLREMESNIRCYEPLVVAIGPVHHGKPKLQLIENCKEKLAIQFADHNDRSWFLSTKSVSIKELYRKVKNIVPSARECYVEELIKDYNDEQFARMMFLDGCFILQYMHCLVTGDKLHMKRHDRAFIRRDLFLLENQIPFEVLQVLMSCKFEQDDGLKLIQEFISSAFGWEYRYPESYTCTQKLKNFFGKNFQGERTSNNKQESSKCPPAHLLELLRTQLFHLNILYEGGIYLGSEWYWYRSAQELRRAGIHFRPGKSHRLSDIKFHAFRCSAHLTLPCITINDSTKSELLNLIAYEACPDTPDDFGVTSYVCFMGSLINNAEDVKVLKSNGILYHFLGDDEEVANLFKELARELVPNPLAFIDVKSRIERYYNSRGKLWVNEAINTRFTSPWDVVSFIQRIVSLITCC